MRQGIRAGACFPLAADGAVIGTFSVFAADNQTLDARTADLLDEIARAVAFAHAKLAADTALAARERDLARAQEAGRIGSVVVDHATGQWITSAVGAALLGLDGVRQRGEAELEAMLAPEDRATTMTLVRSNLTTAGPTTNEYRMVRPSDGQVRWLRVVADSESGADGRPLRRVGTLQDITDQKAAEQRIRRLSMLYEALSRTNEAILREPDFAKLCATACRIAVEHGGMVSSALRLYDPRRRAAGAGGRIRAAQRHPRQGRHFGRYAARRRGGAHSAAGTGWWFRT